MVRVSCARIGVPGRPIVRKLALPEKYHRENIDTGVDDAETVRLPAVAERLQDPSAAAAAPPAVRARAGCDFPGRIAHARVPAEESGRRHPGARAATGRLHRG